LRKKIVGLIGIGMQEVVEMRLIYPERRDCSEITNTEYDSQLPRERLSSTNV